MGNVQSLEQVLLWRIPVLQNLEMRRSHYVTYAFAPHMHEGYAIGVIEHGANVFDCRGTPHIARTGRLIVYNPYEVHTGRAENSSGWTYRMVYPQLPLIERIMALFSERPARPPFFPQSVIHDDDLAQRFVAFHQAIAGASSPLAAESQFLALFSLLLTRHAHVQLTYPPIRAEHRVVRRVQEYLMAHYTEHITLDHLAHLAQFSPVHLLRVFRSATGLPPHAYIVQLRIAHAKTLLQQGCPIAHVALEVGFVDQSHFGKHFRRLVGLTPGQFAQRC